MAQPAPVMPPTLLEFRRKAGQEPELRFQMALLDKPTGAGKTSTTLMVSLVAHAILIAALLLVPILTYNILPAPSEAMRAFFAVPPAAAPPPPPPPPPPAGARTVAKAPAVPAPVQDAKFVAPIETPDTIKPEQTLDLGIEGGVPGGVEGGVPGGVVGGIVGGLPAEAPPPAVKAVRVGGQIKAPKLIKTVSPNYPDLAVQARLSAIIIVEAVVDTSGRVTDVSVLRGVPLFNDEAIAAVKQWRYAPLLLNGVPTQFIVTVTVKFNIVAPSVLQER